ncbi:MAG: HEAT repeat domain-containing protein [Nitrospiraceae bacterium]|nr:HEAT repeat domain-containing protein [Nitrospiraceae bacterium]
MDTPVAANDRDEQRLIVDAIIELITSKRKIGLYPKEHPKIRESLQRAFDDLQSLLAMRGTIMVGIAGDTLIVDDAGLESKNPALRDFARSFHVKGIAAVTFAPGLTMEELQNYHELMVSRDLPVGQALADLAERKGLFHITLTPLDMSKFSFVEDGVRTELTGEKLWEDYVRKLLDGGLEGGDIDEKIANLPPEEIANALNRHSDETTRATIIEGVLRHYFHAGRELQELYTNFLILVENLTPEAKELFLKKALNSPVLAHRQVTKMMKELSSEIVDRMMRLFQENVSILPESLRQLVDKMNEAMEPALFFLQGKDEAFVDDIEVGREAATLFSVDDSGRFVDDRYQLLLDRLGPGRTEAGGQILQEIKNACLDENVDEVITDIMFDLLNAPSATREEYLTILTRLSDFMDHYIDTGRFPEIATFYKKIEADARSGTYREEAEMMRNKIFGSGEFIDRLIGSFRIWGRHDREKVCDLTQVLKEYLLGPLISALAVEQDAMVRRFLIDVLVRVGVDVQEVAAQKLADNRWYVVRNMIYLIRECGGEQYVQNVRPLAKHPDRRVALEAIRTLVHFNTSDSFSYIRHYLQSRDIQARDQIVRIAGTYKVTAAVPYLGELLAKRNFSGGAEHNAALIRALAEIGDPAAIAIFTGIYKSSSFLHRAELEGLRVEIFRHLHFFAGDVAKPLIDLGVQSRNTEIRMMAQRLLLRRKPDGK